MIKQTFMNIHGKILHQILTLDSSYSSEILAILFHSKGEKWNSEWQRLSLFYQDMFIYSGKWQESQVFPQVRTERHQ